MKKIDATFFEQHQTNADLSELPSLSQKFQIQNSDKYPNRLICYIKTKIKSGQNIYQPGIQHILDNRKGTGCLITNKYVLTAAHNIIDRKIVIDGLKNIKMPFVDQTQIQQGLGFGETGEDGKKIISRFDIKEYIVNPNYQKVYKINKQKSLMEDYALLQISPIITDFKQDKFMPIVLLTTQQSLKSIKQISIYGYPIEFNKKKSNQNSNSSLFMNFQCGGSNQIKPFQKKYITYTLPTEEGTSGAPIIAQYLNQHIIIGIHKGGKNTESQGQNLGVSAGQMIETLNDFGYTLEKKPFVYTEKTLYLRQNQNEMAARQILFLMDKGLQAYDILVYTSYDLTNIQKIILSRFRVTIGGNFIGSQGVDFLLRRKYPNINSLFLTQNKIKDLSKIPEQNWKNIQTLSILGLSVNNLITLPEGLMRLNKLQKLWLSHNQIKQFPQVLKRFCKANDRDNLSVYLYENLINPQLQKQNISEFLEYKTRIIWDRDLQEKQS